MTTQWQAIERETVKQAHKLEVEGLKTKIKRYHETVE